MRNNLEIRVPRACPPHPGSLYRDDGYPTAVSTRLRGHQYVLVHAVLLYLVDTNLVLPSLRDLTRGGSARRACVHSLAIATQPQQAVQHSGASSRQGLSRRIYGPDTVEGRVGVLDVDCGVAQQPCVDLWAWTAAQRGRGRWIGIVVCEASGRSQRGRA